MVFNMDNMRKSEIIFYKLYIKSYITKKSSPNQLFLLELIRDEIKIIVFTSVIKQFYLIGYNLRYFDDTNFRIEENLDLIFKLLLISSRNRILKKFKFSWTRYKRSTPLKQDWILGLLDSEDYDVLRIVISNLLFYKDEHVSYICLRLLIEHLVVKMSNLLLYEFFLMKELPSFILDVYSVDRLAFLSYSNKLYSYIRFKLYLNSFPYINKTKDSFGDFFAITRHGITLKSVIIDTFYPNVEITLFKIILIRSLRLFYRIILFLTYLSVKK